MALTDPDETFYAQSAKEMLNRGDWSTPYLYGKPQFEKPILIYWLVEASYKMLGVNETAARLPSAIFALLGVIAIYLLGKLLFDKTAGFLSALMLAANVEYVILSRACITDMLLSMLMLLGALFFFYGYFRSKGYFYILSSAMFALAVLTKGPVAILLPLVIFFIFLVLTGNLGKLKTIPMGWCVLVFLAVAAPWYILEYKLHGREFFDAFFGFQNVTRFMQSEHKIGSQFYYNIPVVLAGFFPWSIFLPFGFWHMFRRIPRAKYQIRRGKEGPVFTLTWFFVIFLFFTVSRTKLPTYIFPCFTSLALIVGVLWSDFLNKDKVTGEITGWVKGSYYFLVIAIIAGAIGISVYLGRHDKMPGILNGVIMSSAILIAGFVISTIAFAKEKYFTALFLIIISLAALLLPLNFMVLPQIEHYETSKDIAQKLRTMIRPGEELGAQSHYMPGLAFYADIFALDLDKHQIMVNFLNSGKKSMVRYKRAESRRAL